MLSTTVIFVASLVSLGSAAFQVRGNVAYFSPHTGGGSMLDNAGNGLGEPLNVIISGLSDPSVLTDDGFLNYAGAIGFSTECLGTHIGDPQSANLGDGNGWVDQTYELRDDYGGVGGTCIESLAGGNHLRMFRQNGPLADSGALFLAVSKEESASEDHDIAPNGYNLGRNDLVAAATAGETSYAGVTYSTEAKRIIGLLAPGSEGINHGISQDGIVVLLTVTIV